MATSAAFLGHEQLFGKSKWKVSQLAVQFYGTSIFLVVRVLANQDALCISIPEAGHLRYQDEFHGAALPIDAGVFVRRDAAGALADADVAEIGAAALVRLPHRCPINL